MTVPITITRGILHILRLAERDADVNGWTVVSKPILHAIISSVPGELLSIDKGGMQVKLTLEGEKVLHVHTNWPLER